MQALSAAGLSAQPEYLSMVDRMMEEQMPIDRESLQQMARLVNANPRIDVQTLVQMQKLGIPITVENASQFENYMNDSQAITRELDALIEQFPQSLTGTEGAPVKTETMRQLGNELLQILTDGLEEVPQQIQSPEPDMAYNLDGLKYESVQTDTTETQMQTEAAPETATEPYRKIRKFCRSRKVRLQRRRKAWPDNRKPKRWKLFPEKQLIPGRCRRLHIHWELYFHRNSCSI